MTLINLHHYPFEFTVNNKALYLPYTKVRRHVTVRFIYNRDEHVFTKLNICSPNQIRDRVIFVSDNSALTLTMLQTLKFIRPIT